MNIADGIKFALNSRGLKNGACRLKRIKNRFGITPKKFLNILNHYHDILKRHEVKATFFIPANILNRYISHIKKMDFENVEWGIHGFVHTDLSRLDLVQQQKQIEKAVEIFDKHHIAFKGFRPPYLRTNSFTVKAIVNTRRFRYLSSHTVLNKEVFGPERKLFQWINDFYHPLSSFSYSFSENPPDFIEIPVALPDDDVMMDRENLDQEAIQRIWSQMLRSTWENNSVFVLQLHPERIFELDQALIQLIKEAKSFNPPVKIVALEELAESKANDITTKGVLCITGDIDAMTIGDFALRLKEW